MPDQHDLACAGAPHCHVGMGVPAEPLWSRGGPGRALGHRHSCRHRSACARVDAGQCDTRRAFSRVRQCSGHSGCHGVPDSIRSRHTNRANGRQRPTGRCYWRHRAHREEHGPSLGFRLAISKRGVEGSKEMLAMNTWAHSRLSSLWFCQTAALVQPACSDRERVSCDAGEAGPGARPSPKQAASHLVAIVANPYGRVPTTKGDEWLSRRQPLAREVASRVGEADPEYFECWCPWAHSEKFMLPPY